jgi:hypothetical protein
MAADWYQSSEKTYYFGHINWVLRLSGPFSQPICWFLDKSDGDTDKFNFTAIVTSFPKHDFVSQTIQLLFFPTAS